MLATLQEEKLFYWRREVTRPLCGLCMWHINNTYGKIKITQAVFVKYQELWYSKDQSDLLNIISVSYLIHKL